MMVIWSLNVIVSGKDFFNKTRSLNHKERLINMSTLNQEILIIKSNREESRTGHNLEKVEKDVYNTYNQSFITKITLIPRNKF